MIHGHCPSAVGLLLVAEEALRILIGDLMLKHTSRLLTTGLMLVFAMTLGSVAHAAIEGGDARKGKQLAVESCKPCHVQGAEAGTMTPLSRTQRQWDRFYKKRRHDKIAPGAWDDIAEQDLQDILQFMYDHAADSDQPATCGQ